jgi:DNA-binding HxlR family transcriptional regulator
VAEESYKQFCPVAMAAEILCTRWTLLVLREFVAGSKRFNELRRGVPRMSPALLSKRLKDLERAGLLERRQTAGALPEYRLTAAGEELRPVIEAIGVWGKRWIETKAALDNLDPELLMWDIRRNIDPSPLPPRRSVIQFIYTDLPDVRRDWWLVVEPQGTVDLCAVDPGFDVDLYLVTDLRTMTEVWMGYASLGWVKAEGRLVMTGDRGLEAAIGTWLKLSPFAPVARVVA